jgi:hypothetical protein
MSRRSRGSRSGNVWWRSSAISPVGTTDCHLVANLTHEGRPHELAVVRAAWLADVVRAGVEGCGGRVAAGSGWYEGTVG